MTIKVKLNGTEWKNGRIMTYGTRHTIHAETPQGSVNLVYEIGRGSYRFRGIERVIANPAGEFAGDFSPITQSLGPDSVAKAAWIRAYTEDKQRRSYFE